MPTLNLSKANWPEKEYTIPIVQFKPTIAFFSTYPPRECGIATFTQDLLQSSQKLLGPLINCKVAAINLSPLDTYKYPPEVEWKIDQNSKKDYKNLAKIFNEDKNISGVIIQHEYGIFGGEEGELLLKFMENCTKPLLVTLHTVLPNPNPHMKDLTEKIIEMASTLIVLTDKSRGIIEELYPKAHGKVFTIPHGIHSVPLTSPKAYKTKLKLNRYTILTTFGLLGRGKGIEYVLQALPEVIKKYPNVIYLVLGGTHPVVQRAEGEKYRHELANLTVKLGIEKHVRFYDQYFNLPDLFSFLKATDIYIATSTDPNQAVSGTLSYALGAGRAVISTDFSQAKELVTPDVGRIIPIKNPPALTAALIELLSDKTKLLEMNKDAYDKTRVMLWSNVASEYLMLLQRMVIPPIKLDHLLRMTDDFGLFQFANHSRPNKEHGYTLDDNARALILCNWLMKMNYKYKETSERLMQIYLTFIRKCLREDGSFINYIAYQDKIPTLQNKAEDLEEANARAVWALCELITNNQIPKRMTKEAASILLKSLPSASHFTHIRSQALTIKSLSLVLDIFPEKKEKLLFVIRQYANSLLSALREHSIKDWRWFEDDLIYNNAILPEGLIIAGRVLGDETYTTYGLLSLDFLISKTFSTTYMPIGHSSWYKHNQTRSSYDQQPEDPASMIFALFTAYHNTNQTKYKKLANICFSWFLGNNSLKKPLYDVQSGGCYDGLHPNRVNLNQGAESLVSYLMANIKITDLNS